jgi:Fur family transcriptional regulator, ferric uptake regulator
VTEFRSDEVREVEHRVAAEYGFAPARHRLEIYGLCRDCRTAGVELPLGGLSCPIETV